MLILIQEHSLIIYMVILIPYSLMKCWIARNNIDILYLIILSSPAYIISLYVKYDSVWKWKLMSSYDKDELPRYANSRENEDLFNLIAFLLQRYRSSLSFTIGSGNVSITFYSRANYASLRHRLTIERTNCRRIKFRDAVPFYDWDHYNARK